MGAYVRFCSSQLTSAGLLQNLIEIKPGFDEFIRKCQSHPKVKGMPLSFFMLKPVKRVMDYPILVEKILKNTPKGHPDHFLLEKALELSKELCEQVNEGTRHKENTERLEWLQIHLDSAKNPALTLDEKLTFNSVTNLMGPRKFLHHGLLKKAKSTKEIIAFLCNDFLLLTYPNKSVAPQFSFEKHFDIRLNLYKKPILLDQFTVLDHGPDKRKSITSNDQLEFGIEILGAVETYGFTYLHFEAQNIHDRKMWMQKLNDAIASYTEKADIHKSKKESGNCLNLTIFVYKHYQKNFNF